MILLNNPLSFTMILSNALRAWSLTYHRGTQDWLASIGSTRLLRMPYIIMISLQALALATTRSNLHRAISRVVQVPSSRSSCPRLIHRNWLIGQDPVKPDRCCLPPSTKSSKIHLFIVLLSSFLPTSPLVLTTCPPTSESTPHIPSPRPRRCES